MQPFTAAPHDDVLALLVQFAALLVAARALGEVARRLRQPSVLGELSAGILLGPSVLAGLLPGLGEWIVPQTAVQGYLLETVAMLGALLLLLVTGLETDIGLIRRHARTAIGVSWCGILTTFGTGFLLGQSLPDFLLADPEQRFVFSLFIATAMSISAIPVIAKVLLDLKLMRRDIGQTIIAAGMSDDTIGWILLSIVAGLAAGRAFEPGRIIMIAAIVIGFLVFSLTAGRVLARAALAFVQQRVVSDHKVLTLTLVLVLGWAAVTQALRLEAVLGAFIMGVILGQLPRLSDRLRESVEAMAFGVFTPVFFAVAGLKVDLSGLREPRLVAVALAVIGVATLGKVVGTYAGARLIGRRDHWTALAFGAALNARGAMEIIVATIGLNLGILSQTMFSVIVLMAMVTSFMAPPALRWILARMPPDESETRRLDAERLARRSFVARLGRVLLPVRQRPGEAGAAQVVEAALVSRLARRNVLSLVLFNVSPPGQRAAGMTFLAGLEPYFAQTPAARKVTESSDPANTIIDEVGRDYDLLLLGAPERDAHSDTLFTPLVDYLVRFSPCPTLVVRAERPPASWQPRRILVPTNGSMAARNAAELAFALATEPGDEVLLLNVAIENPNAHRLDATGELLERQLGIGHQVIAELRALAEAHGVRATGTVTPGPDPEGMILQMAAHTRADLILLGTNVRPASHRLFLGPRVERILGNAPCPVVVLNT